MLKNIEHKFKYENYNITLETGLIANRATSSVLAKMNDTVVLITIVKNHVIDNKKDLTFSSFNIIYNEKFYSFGKIPPNFFRREGKQSEREILISRIIDRSIRPILNLYKCKLDEIQITITVMSIDPDVNPDIISIIGVSAALSISEIISDENIIGSSKIVKINNDLLFNVNLNESKKSNIELIISGTSKYISTIELFSNFEDEKSIINSIEFGYKSYLEIINNIKIFKEKFKLINNNILECNIINNNENIYSMIYELSFDEINNIYNNINSKLKRIIEINKLKLLIINKIKDIIFSINENEINLIFSKIEKSIFRNKLLNSKSRLDDRKFNEIRDIDIKIGFLPRTHGSSIFTRGSTQSIAITTLGSIKDAKNLNNFLGDNIEKFIFHYNFPPYCVGEIGNFIIKRREIGHGNLAKRGILPSIPNDLPYTIRLVSEITESDGSSSMASICSSSLSLMDSGIPIKSQISGIAMGLIKEKDNFIILSDISGDEDNFGDMDFKISGNEYGITALQMDTKILDINIDILKKIIKQSYESRLLILNKMNDIISKPKSNMSKYTPIINLIKIEKEKIKDLIGVKGFNIRKIIKETGSIIDIQDDDGNISIISKNKKIYDITINKIKSIISNIEINKVYNSHIIKIYKFGLIVLLPNNKEGLIHISNIKNNYNLFEKFKLNQKLTVKVININLKGKINLIIEKI